jgi:branched-chain amino acid transport system ATP-binding protein
LARLAGAEGGGVTGALLEVRGLERRFGGLVAVGGVDLAVRDGEIRALIGPNGAGKTTLINLLSGFLPPTAGEVLWEGESIARWSVARRVRAGIARTMQVTSVFPNLSVHDNVWLGAQRRLRRLPALTDRRRLTDVAEWVGQCLALVGLENRAAEPAASIGHGDQRLLEIAIGLSLRPRVLLLDEPTAGMSVRETGDIVRRLKEIHRRDGIAMVIVEHDMQVVMELAQQVTVLHLGQTLAEGPPAEIGRNADVQRVYLGGR